MSRLRINTFLFLVLILLSDVIGGNLPAKFRFRHYSVDNGMPSNIVRTIIQGKDGYMWIGTEDGLCRFDGNNFQIFNALNNPVSELRDNYINTLFEDSESRIWIGTDHGLYYYCYKTATIHSFTSVTDNGITISSQVNNINEDNDKNIWVSTFGQGAFKYSLKSEKLENYEFSETSRLLNQIYIDESNTIWVVSRHNDNYLYKYNKVLNCFQQFNTTYAVPSDKNGFLCILEESTQYMWLGTWDKGLQKLDRHTGIITTELPNDTKHGLTHIHSLSSFTSDIVMIGSDDGLSFYNTQTGEYKLVVPDETEPFSLSDKFIYPITMDKEGGIWVGTYYGGINYLSSNTNQFDSYTHSRFKNSVGGKIISRFCEDKDGNIWIGSDDGGLSKYDPHKNTFCNYISSPDKNSLSYPNVHALCMDNDNLWIGTYTGGLNILNSKTGVFKHFNYDPADEKTIDGSSIYSIFRDREENMWVTSMSGINRYDRLNDNFIRVKDLGYMTIDIDQDSNGEIWFATQGKGIFRYNPKGDSWTNYSSENENNNIFCNMVNDIHIDEKDVIWAATSEGLCKYDRFTDKFHHINFSKSIYNTLGITSNNSTLWITTSKGLVHYHPVTDKMQVYSKSDGLQSNQFLPSSILKTSDNRIYVGTVDGFNSFSPQNMLINSYIPTVVITEVDVMNESYQLNNNKMELSYKQNVFTIHFAALSYCTPVKNMYEYKLEGFDKNWIFAGDNKSATYTNLPAGTYKFKVRGSNNDGVWNEEGTSLQIRIYPPFYKTIYFKLFCIIILAALVVMLIKYYVTKTEMQHQSSIRKLSIEKDEEIQRAKIQFFTVIAHEIRTPVSLIIGPMSNIMKTFETIPDNLKTDLDIINRNGVRLLSLVNQLLDYRKMEQGEFSVNKFTHNINSIIETIVIRFKPSAAQKGVNIVYETEDKDFRAVIDPEALTKIVSNLLTNALKFTKDTIILKMSIDYKKDLFYISVSDNGCGITKEQQKKIFKPFYQTDCGVRENGTGIGLHIVKSLIEAHKGNISVRSEINAGTEFMFSIPIGEINNEKNQPFMENNVSTDYEIPLSPEMKTADEGAVKSLLVVEDNEDMLNFVKSSLSDEYKVHTASNGIEATEVLKKQSVSLVISDWMMPEMDGITLCRNIRDNQRTNHIPFILLTAKTDEISKIKGMEIGADMHIEKPFCVDYLKASVRNMILLRSKLHQKLSSLPVTPLDSIADNCADKRLLKTLNEIIEENFSNNELTVEFIAKKMNISRSGLFSKIKNLTDVTPNDLIQMVRMKKAAELLLENKYRVNEICYMVGFNNPSYFSKCFQKQFGMKPLDFLQSKMEAAKEEIRREQAEENSSVAGIEEKAIVKDYKLELSEEKV